MKKWACFFIFFCILTAGCWKTREPLTVLISPQFPPFISVEETQKLSRSDQSFQPEQVYSGFDIDFIMELARRAHVTVVYKEVAFDEIFKKLEKNEASLSISNITITQDRLKRVDFSIPYLSDGHVVIVKDPAIDQLKDLKKKTIGVLKDTVFDSQFDDFFEADALSVEKKATAIMTDIYVQLHAGFIDGILTGKAEGIAFIQKYADYHVITLENLACSNSIGIAFPKGSALKKEFDVHIQNMLKDGTIQKIKEKWKIA